MSAFLWGAVVGGLICILIGAVAGADGVTEDNHKIHVRTEWTAWFIILIAAVAVSIYLHNYAGAGR